MSNRGCGSMLLVGAVILLLIGVAIWFVPSLSNVRESIETAVIESQAQVLDPAVGGVSQDIASVTLNGQQYAITGLTMIVSDRSQCRPADASVPCVVVPQCFSGCSASFVNIRVDSADDLMYLDGNLVTTFDATVDALFYDVPDGEYTLRVQNTIARWYNLYIMPRFEGATAQGLPTQESTQNAPAVVTPSSVTIDGRAILLETELKLVRAQTDCGEHANCVVAPTCFAQTGCIVEVVTPLLFTSVDASATLNNNGNITTYTFDQLKDAAFANIAAGRYTLTISHPTAGNAFFDIAR
ncbi:MAG: hypothetical protein QY314_03630 [Candidatus Dojkabacteria bacterium]|nr:MAG: hypothetical protein QY314_03630 [Candidatus Dojkabacteria bacterium]